VLVAVHAAMFTVCREGRVVLADAPVLEAHALVAHVGDQHVEVEGCGGGGARDLPDLERVGTLVVGYGPGWEGLFVVRVRVGAEEVGFADLAGVGGCEADAGGVSMCGAVWGKGFGLTIDIFVEWASLCWTRWMSCQRSFREILKHRLVRSRLRDATDASRFHHTSRGACNTAAQSPGPPSRVARHGTWLPAAVCFSCAQTALVRLFGRYPDTVGRSCVIVPA